jgi:hypothetical protein
VIAARTYKIMLYQTDKGEQQHMRGNRLRRYIIFGAVLFIIFYFIQMFFGLPNIGSILAAAILAFIVSAYIMSKR